MGLSETIVAAIIGASATVSAAGFNLLRARTPPGTKPRRGTLRSASLLAVLVIASAAGGFAYSEFRAQGAREELARLRAAMDAQLQSLVHCEERAAQPPVEPASSEALVQLAPCVRSAPEVDGPAPACLAATAPITLCTQVPAAAERLGVELYSRPLGDPGAWQRHAPADDPGGLDVAFAAVADATAGGIEAAAVCVDVRSEDPGRTQVARLVVRYRALPPREPPARVPPAAARS